MLLTAAALSSASHGAVAQLGERLDRTQEVAGSSPASSTIKKARPSGPFLLGKRVLHGVSSPGVLATMIEFDLNGRKLALEETVVRELRERALARAGSSSTLNDLAVILTRALSEQRPVTLRRAESRALERLLEFPT